MFDGTGDAVTGPVELLLEDGVIRAVTTSPPGADRDADVDLDLGDAVLHPGRVDAHTHLCWDPCSDPVGQLQQVDDDALHEQAAAGAAVALAAGVTTVRDLGDRNYVTVRLRDELRTRPSDGPEIVAAGPPLTTTHGHCWFLHGEADTADEIRRGIAARAERGVDVIKMMVTGGNLTPGTSSHESQYRRDLIAVAVEEAHRRGLPVTGHAHGRDGIADAVAAGIDGIEHAGFWTETSAEVLPDVVEQMVRQGTFVTLTPGFAAKGTMDPSEVPPGVAARLPAIVAAIRTMVAAGVRLAIATDAGIASSKTHDALPYALPFVGMAGFTPASGLRAMTSAAADAVGLGHRKGRIAVGYDADLVAVAADPLVEPETLQQPVAVIRAGVRVR